MLAFHYPKPEYRDQMVKRIERASAVMATQPGFLAADCWIDEDGDAVVAVGTFDSKEQWLAAMQVITAADVDFEFDAREREPRRVQLLMEA